MLAVGVLACVFQSTTLSLYFLFNTHHVGRTMHVKVMTFLSLLVYHYYYIPYMNPAQP